MIDGMHRLARMANMEELFQVGEAFQKITGGRVFFLFRLDGAGNMYISGASRNGYSFRNVVEGVTKGKMKFDRLVARIEKENKRIARHDKDDSRVTENNRRIEAAKKVLGRT